MNAPNGFGAPQRQTTFREFLAVVFRRRWIIVSIFLITTATVAVIVFTTPLTYISSGRVLLKRGEQTSVLQSDRRVFSDWEQDLGSEVELARSEPVLAQARTLLEAEAAAEGVAAPPIDHRSVDIEVLGKSNVLGIHYVSRNPEVARRVCDAVMRAYVDFRQSHLGMMAYPKSFFDQALADVNRDLAQMLERRRRYTGSERVADVAEERRGLVNEVGSLRLRESELNADLAEAEATVRVMRELSARPDVETPIPQTMAGADAVFELNRRIVEQEARIAQLLERFREESAEVQNARRTVRTLKDLLAREVAAKIAVAESRISVLRSQIGAVREDLARRQSSLDGMPEKEIALGELDRQIKVLRDRYAELVEKSDLARVTQNTTSNLAVLVLERPGPAQPANARDWVRLALAPAFSLLVGIGLAFFIDGLDITVRTAGQAEEATSLPVLASLSDRRRRRA